MSDGAGMASVKAKVTGHSSVMISVRVYTIRFFINSLIASDIFVNLLNCQKSPASCNQ